MVVDMHNHLTGFPAAVADQTKTLFPKIQFPGYPGSCQLDLAQDAGILFAQVEQSWDMFFGND